MAHLTSLWPFGSCPKEIEERKTILICQKTNSAVTSPSVPREVVTKSDK